MAVGEEAGPGGEAMEQWRAGGGGGGGRRRASSGAVQQKSNNPTIPASMGTAEFHFPAANGEESRPTN